MKPVRRLAAFYEETVQEVKKCTWPSRPELAESTIVVILSMLFLTVFVGVVDFVFQMVIRWIIQI